VPVRYSLDGAKQIEQTRRDRDDAGDWEPAGQLAELLVRRGNLDGLRARADDGDRGADGQNRRRPDHQVYA
jgi:hypothetical protein